MFQLYCYEEFTGEDAVTVYLDTKIAFCPGNTIGNIQYDSLGHFLEHVFHIKRVSGK